MAIQPPHGGRPGPAAPGTVRMGEGARSGLVLLNDEPVTGAEDDELGARWVAEQLSALLLASRRSTPFTLALEGGWGMGKSSLMRLVDAKLQDTDGVHTVWYNAWSSTGADALEGLIKSVLAQFDPNVLRRALRRLQGGSGLARVVRALTLVAAGPLGVAGMVDALWRALSVDATARNRMRDALRRMVADWTAAPRPGAPGRLLVIFIDDLDRCSQETVLALCEALKVYLDVPGLAFVIGCDREAMSEEGMLRNLTPAGAAFMEKIFQTSYRIPAPGNRDIQRYVWSCAGRAGIADLLDQQLVELLGYRAARNPRRVKTLVNGLLLEANLNPSWSDLSTEAVIITLLLRYLYMDFYRLMTAQNEPGSQPEVVDTFFEYCAVRTLLRAGSHWSARDAERVEGFLARYAMAPPEGEDQHDREDTLRVLEGELPDRFPALAIDQTFVSLLWGLRELEGAELVLQRLREGMDRPLEPLPPSPSEPPAGWVAPAMVGLPDSGEPTMLPGARGEPGSSVPGGDRPGAGRPSGDSPSGNPPGEDGSGEDGSGGDRPVGNWPTGNRPGGNRSTSTPQASPRTTTQPPAARPAGPVDPVSPALDPQDTETFPVDYPLPAGYAQRMPSSLSPGGDGRGARPPVVVVAGFTSGAAGAVGFALRRGGLDHDFDFYEELWPDVLAREPRAVLCHVAAFGTPGRGFELIRGARDDGYRGVVVFYTPTLTPNERLAADRLDAEITNDPDQAAALLWAGLRRPQTGPPAASG
ncbi:P-loop NTPase fold protein [Streptomyces sp. NBC_00669]|uniref:KAP family P-loop NTPase fold protein n=1 Tax=Streptomyces sp. NBC_00669 TaxID=2976011 RepID=UPI002E360B16|nr:P-loop NTPase fold protein [Streptomyces sp. NBC_00669]